MSEVHGTCDARFARVRDLFAEQLANPEELGASLAVTIGGRRVVDLWGGVADEKRTQPWTPDTLVNLFSTTKGLAAICAHRLVDQGKLDLDAPVARYWPEFAQADKGEIPVRWLLDHSAGLPAIETPLPAGSAHDWKVMTDALAAQAPWWKPGTEHGYHALTYGWLVGEVVRRVSGRSIGTYLREEIAGPLGADFWIGAPPELDGRIADIVMSAPKPGDADLMIAIVAQAKPYALKAFLNPIPAPGGMNGRAWRAAEIPAANGHGSARALARIYGAVASGTQDGVMMLSREAVDRARTVQRSGFDNVLPLLETRFGLGFQIGTDSEPIGPNPRAFGHSGMGGSFGFADPETELGFGYAMNRMENGVFLIGPRATALMNATYASLA
jgi:CubicO group peptidase (beta-lactamase class C family)